MIRQGQDMRSLTDRILGTDRHIFKNVAIRDPIHNTNHYMVMWCLCDMNPRDHQHYLGLRARLPLYTPKQPSHEDSLLISLRQVVTKTPERERAYASWIL